MTDVPEKIPEDIDRTATDIVRANYISSGDEPEWLMYKAIAEALLAERLAQKERDAKVVEAIGSVGRDWALTSFMGSLRRDIAAAIRQS